MDNNIEYGNKRSPFANAVYLTKNFILRHGLKILSAIGAALSFGICLYYIFGPSEGYLHSDCTDSILWANATVESGNVFDENFRYAAMLPFSSSIWFVPLIKLFGYKMSVQLWGMAIFLTVFSLSVFFMAYGYSKSVTLGFNMVSAMLLILTSSDKLREIMLGHTIYYSLSLLMICLMLCFYFCFCRSFEKQNKRLASTIVFAALIIILFAGNATNGFQVIAISTIPVLAAIVAERFFDGKTKLFSKNNFPMIITAVLITVSTVLGLVILGILKGDKFSNYASAYSSFSAVNEWYGNFTKFVDEYFSLIGANVTKGMPLFSKDSLPYLIRIAGGVTILALPVAALFGYKHLKDSGTKILLWVHLATSAVIMVGFICGKLSTANWRLTPMVGTAVMASVAYVRELVMGFKERVCGFRFGLILCAVLILFSGVTFREIKKMPADYGRDNYLHILAEDLEERGLTYGYATFWRSQSITLISDSKVKCRETLVNSKGIITDYYQSSKLWYEDQAGVDKYFVILSKSEYDTASKTQHWKDIMEKYYVEQFISGGCYVFVFNSNIILKGDFVG